MRLFDNPHPSDTSENLLNRLVERFRQPGDRHAEIQVMPERGYWISYVGQAESPDYDRIVWPGEGHTEQFILDKGMPPERLNAHEKFRIVRISNKEYGGDDHTVSFFHGYQREVSVLPVMASILLLEQETYDKRNKDRDPEDLSEVLRPGNILFSLMDSVQKQPKFANVNLAACIPGAAVEFIHAVQRRLHSGPSSQVMTYNLNRGVAMYGDTTHVAP